MVDSIGKANDQAYHAKLRSLEQQRVRELEHIEERNKQQLLKAEEAREAALKNVYENQTNEVGNKREEVEAKINQIKKQSDDYVRNVQADTQKLAEEAKKQFESKARVLTKNAQEFDEQRKFMLKQHNDTVKRMKDDQERTYYETAEKAQRQASEAYIRNQKNIKNVQESGERDLAQLKQQFQALKSTEQLEGQRAIDNLQFQRDNDKAALQRNIDFNARAAEEQNKYLRAQYEAQLAGLKSDFESEASSIQRQAQSKLNKEHMKGRRELSDTQGLYSSQVEQTRKDAIKKIKDSQLQGQVNLNRVERENKTNEEIAQQNHRIRTKLLEEESSQTLKGHEQRNAQLKEKLDTAYKKQSEEMGNQKAQLLVQQREQAQQEIANTRNKGKEQVNQFNAKYSEILAEHGKKNTDPFYKTQLMKTLVSDSPQETVIVLDVPEHEQDLIRLSRQENSLTVSGSRRSQNKAELPDGHVAQSNSFQSYSESFPVKGKLLMDQMSRTYDGGRLTFRIPKG